MFEANETLEAARERNVRDALAEDIGRGDWTAQLVPATQRVRARVIVREKAVLCGRDWFEACVLALDAQARIDWHHAEGASMAADAAVCHSIRTPVRCSRPNARRSISCSCSRPPRP
jgi:nicotinate-nucleotide pyrophosphorylase (carboxylating)